MERAPSDLDCERVFQDLEGIKGVNKSHCCHVWCITPDKIALTAHLHIESGLHEEVLEQANIILKHRYGIHHSTIQISEDEDPA
jgi:cobalt-zinc-cadmium efflux system protein